MNLSDFYKKNTYNAAVAADLQEFVCRVFQCIIMAVIYSISLLFHLGMCNVIGFDIIVISIPTF